MSGARELYLEAGLNDYASKPIKPTALLSKVAAFGSKQTNPA
jgi:hypothetical protein